MVASSLVDSVLGDNTSSERSRPAVEQFVQSALLELAQIEKLDDSLAPEDVSQFDRRTAALLRDEYERWATSTALLLSRIDHFEHRFGTILNAESLRDAYGKTRARLSISVDDMEKSIKAMNEGRVVPMAEVRRGLL